MNAQERDVRADEPRVQRRRGLPPKPIAERLAAMIVVDEKTGCHLWQGGTNLKGYGRLKADRKRTLLPHRVAYELAKGPIPPGLVLDHLCRTPACCNPAHLEAVTVKENTRRGNSGKKELSRTHCPKGHPYDEANTYRTPEGHRGCRACWPMRGARAREKANAKRRALHCSDSPNSSSTHKAGEA